MVHDPTRIPGYYPASVDPNARGAPAFRGGGIVPPAGQTIIFPWWLYEMPGSADFEINAINFVAAAAATTDIADFNFRVQTGNRGVLTFLQATVQSPTATMDLRFRLFVNQGPVEGWRQLVIPPLSATAFVQPFNGLVIRMNEGDVLTAKVIVASGGPFTCSLQGRGWTTPINVIDSFSSGVKY